MIDTPPDETILAELVLTRTPCGGFLLRYRAAGRDGGEVAGCFATTEDDALDLGLAMVRTDRAAVEAARAVFG